MNAQRQTIRSPIGEPARRETVGVGVGAVGVGGAVGAGGPVAALHQALSAALAESQSRTDVVTPAPSALERMIAGSSRLAGPLSLAMTATMLVWAIR